MRTFANIVAGLFAVFNLVTGVWAFAAPKSFADNIASYPPYNEHLTHDIGAFLIGLGVAALAGLLLSDALATGLAGVAAASLMHGVAHIMDAGHGGRASDPWTVSLFGLLALAGFLAALGRAGRRASAAPRSPSRAPSGPPR
jgi:uncharacterized membrane protein HdeD (DUF308 family)